MTLGRQPTQNQPSGSLDDSDEDSQPHETHRQRTMNARVALRSKKSSFFGRSLRRLRSAATKSSSGSQSMESNSSGSDSHRDYRDRRPAGRPSSPSPKTKKVGGGRVLSLARVFQKSGSDHIG